MIYQQTRRARRKTAHFGGFLLSPGDQYDDAEDAAVKYTKPALDFAQQADLLLSRGMTGDRDLMIDRLRTVSYYRLSGYAPPFRQQRPGTPSTLLCEFRPGTTFEEVWDRYVFDRRLRLLAMDAIERIEVAVRSLLATHHALAHGPFAYFTDVTALPYLRADARDSFIESINKEHLRSRDVFVKHFWTKYGDTEETLPLWMAVEIMSLGSLLSLYRGSHQNIQRLISQPFGVDHSVFQSWLLTLNTVRNICAHHGRLWNREIGTKPKIPHRLAAWQSPVRVPSDRVFATLTICKWSLDRIAPAHTWSRHVRDLLEESPTIPLHSMGFPANWMESPIWRRS